MNIRAARRRWRAASAGDGARGRALRALCLRRGTRQRFRRTDRSVRAAKALRTGNGGEGARLWRALSRSTRISWPRWRRCRLRPASRSVSTGLRCSPPAPARSTTSSGLRRRDPAPRRPSGGRDV